MARLHLSRGRTVETRQQNLGNIIIFCEGNTEKYYFDYFAEIFQKNNNKYDNLVVEVQSANGDAKTVFEYAKSVLSEERESRLYGNYEKYLVFDCDAPKNIKSVINNALSCEHQFHLLISNHFFETWLLMYFENVDKKMTKRETYNRLTSHLSKEYKKAKKGVIREILSKGNADAAINNATALNVKYDSLHMNIVDSIDKMNPYTSVYTLVEQLMLLIS